MCAYVPSGEECGQRRELALRNGQPQIAGVAASSSGAASSKNRYTYAHNEVKYFKGK